MDSKDWFAAWFDTSYYHSLYKNRDENEAKLFITKLIDFLELKKNSNVLDLACGKGRHSITLNELGMNVIGVDLSENSINIAKQFENDSLKFDVHDMRTPIKNTHFDVVFNLFTSFGYFDDCSDNTKVIQSVYNMLTDSGLFVLDFMNSEKIIENLVKEEVKMVDNIMYTISRNYDNQHIFKQIQFNDKGQQFNFTERVQALKLNDFETLLMANKFQIIHTFGNFKLDPFDAKTSDRLILIARKK